MKKCIMLGCLLTLIWSCTVDEGSGNNFHFEIMPIANVEVPDTFESGNLNRINYSYYLPTNCHGYNNLYYIENGNQRTIAVVTTVTETFGTGLECQPLIDELDDRSFDIFAPPGLNTMILNFWQGEDENGEDIYLTVEVPVSE